MGLIKEQTATSRLQQTKKVIKEFVPLLLYLIALRHILPMMFIYAGIFLGGMAFYPQDFPQLNWTDITTNVATSANISTGTARLLTLPYKSALPNGYYVGKITYPYNQNIASFAASSLPVTAVVLTGTIIAYILICAVTSNGKRNKAE